jgi:hypothetical protein
MIPAVGGLTIAEVIESWVDRYLRSGLRLGRFLMVDEEYFRDKNEVSEEADKSGMKRLMRHTGNNVQARIIIGGVAAYVFLKVRIELKKPFFFEGLSRLSPESVVTCLFDAGAFSGKTCLVPLPHTPDLADGCSAYFQSAGEAWQPLIIVSHRVNVSRKWQSRETETGVIGIPSGAFAERSRVRNSPRGCRVGPVLK